MAEINYDDEGPVSINYVGRVTNGSSDGTGNSMLHPGHLVVGDFYVAQKPLPKFFLFEKNLKIYTYDDIPITINLSFLLYILIAIGFAMIPALFKEHEDLNSWMIMAAVVLLFQIISVLLSIFLHFWTITLFIASQHAIHIWPFGAIGFGYDYSKKKFQFIAEILAPCSVYFIFFVLLFVSTILLESMDTHMLPLSPMKDHLASNIVNELWKDEAALLVLHLLCPCYPFAIARIIATSLYPSKNIKQIAQALLIPSMLCAFIFLAAGIYLFAPYLLFAGMWCLYQDLLWMSAIKRKSVHLLPLYQMMDTMKVRDVNKEQEVIDMQEHEFQRYRKTIVKQRHQQQPQPQPQQQQQRQKQQLQLERQPPQQQPHNISNAMYPNKGHTDDIELDTHTVNPMFSSQQQHGILSQYNRVDDFSPPMTATNQHQYNQQSPPHMRPLPQTQNNAVPMIKKRKKRKRRDANGRIMYDAKGNIIYQYKYFMVPDPNYNPNNFNPNNSNPNYNLNIQKKMEFESERFRTSEPDIRRTNETQTQTHTKKQKQKNMSISITEDEDEEDEEDEDVDDDDNEDDDDNDNEDDDVDMENMPPAPPPNIREKHSRDNHFKQRKSKQFGFRQKDKTDSDHDGLQLETLDTLQIQKQHQFIGASGQRGSLAIRLRSDSGKEQQLVHYIAPQPQHQDLTAQDNVNPLAFALQKKTEKKRKKKQKQNALSTSWSSKEEKKIKKKLRKQRKYSEKQKETDISIEQGREHDIMSIPGPPAAIQPPTVTTSDSEENTKVILMTNNNDIPKVEVTFSPTKNDSERTHDSEEKADILVRDTMSQQSTSYDFQGDAIHETQSGDAYNNNHKKHIENGSSSYMSSASSSKPSYYMTDKTDKNDVDNDSVIGFQPPPPCFPQALTKKLPSKPLPSKPKPSPSSHSQSNNGYGRMVAPPSRVQRQQIRASKAKPQIWGINENASDDGDDWKKNAVLGDYDRRKSKINDMTSEDSMRRLDNAKKRKSIFDDSSDDSSGEDNERRLTVDLTNARNYSVSGAMGRL